MGNDPTLQQLRAFKVVATELHFGRAAKRMHTTQPPLTRHIKALESSLHLTLLTRDSRKVELTDAGRTFLAEVDIVIARLERAVEMARATADGVRGRLAVGYVESLAATMLPSVLPQFVLLHPHLEVDLRELDTRDQLQGLHDGSLDCGLLRAPGNVDPLLAFEHVWDDVFVAALPDGHPLAADGGEAIEPGRLAEEPFIAYEGRIGQGMISAMLGGCAAGGFTPQVTTQARNTLMLLAHVAADHGVAMVSQEVARREYPGVRFVPIKGDPAVSAVHMAWPQGAADRAPADLAHLLRRVGRHRG